MLQYISQVLTVLTLVTAYYQCDTLPVLSEISSNVIRDLV